MSKSEDVFAAGLQARREMFGSFVDRQNAAMTEFTQPLDDLVTRYCFGEVWDRPPLDRKLRSMLTLAILCGSTRPTQFKVHVRGAIQNGVTKEEIREVLLHSMLYVGIPAGVDSFMQAAEVLKELGLD